MTPAARRLPRLPVLPAALMIALAATACTNSDARIGILPAVTPQPDLVVSFSRDVEPIFTQTQVQSQTCARSGCHGGGFLAIPGFDLGPGKAYGSLVNVPSIEVQTLLRVAPGDSAESYLIHKLMGAQAVGTQMPQGGPPLSDVQIKLIRDWIDQGAENN